MRRWVEIDEHGAIRRWSSSPEDPSWIEIGAEVDPLSVRIVDGVAVPVEAMSVSDPAEVLADALRRALDRVHQAVSTARTRYITDLPGQSMIYLAKEAEARAWLAAAAPDIADYPLLAAEVGITAPDPDDLAQLWLNLAAIWRAAAASLEAIRLTAPARLAAATDPDAVRTVADTILEELD